MYVADWFHFFVSIVNFAVMFTLFRQVVILPMHEAVRVRAERVQKKLDEIEKVLVEAREANAKYAAQFAALAKEKDEMKEAAEQEVRRTRERLEKQSARDCAHQIEKAKVEAGKMRVKAMEELQAELARRAVTEAREMLRSALDDKAQADLTHTFIGRLGLLCAS